MTPKMLLNQSNLGNENFLSLKFNSNLVSYVHKTPMKY